MSYEGVLSHIRSILAHYYELYDPEDDCPEQVELNERYLETLKLYNELLEKGDTI